MDDKERAIEEANKAKEILEQISNKLYEMGYKQKAKSCMTLVFKIEEWQNK